MQQQQTSWCCHLGGCRWLWVGNASTFLSDGDEYGVHLMFFFIPLPRNRAVCHRLQGPLYHLPPERGNQSVLPFTSPAFRLAESIRQDRPSDSPPPFHFCQVYIRPNYFSLGCQSCFLDRPIILKQKERRRTRGLWRKCHFHFQC